MSAPHTTQLVPIQVPTTDRQIMATQIDGRALVSLRHACETIGVDFASQLTKLNRRSWACVVMITTQLAGDIQRREVAMIDRRTFMMWLATIDTNRVSDDARPIIEAFQAEAADALDAYFSTGVAVATQQSPAELILAQAQALVDQERRLGAVEHQQATLSARIDAITPTQADEVYYSARAWARLNGLDSSREYLRRLGGRAGVVGRAAGLTADKIPDNRDGTVNGWPLWVWDNAFDQIENGASEAAR